MKLKFWVLLILFSLAVACGIIYYASQPTADVGSVVVHHLNKELPSTTTTSESDLKDWKTYINNGYGFEFRYPANLVVIQDKSGYITVHDPNLQPDFDLGLSFSDIRQRGDMTLDEFVHNNKTYEPGDFQESPATQSLTNGISTYKYTMMLAAEEDQHTFFLKTAVSGVDASYAISYFRYEGIGYDPSDKKRFPDPSTINNSHIKDFEQILSTFKFTTATSSAPTQTPPSQPAQADTSGGARYLKVGESLSYNTPWNFDPPNITVTYTSTDKGFSFEVPFNNKWGNANIKLYPFEETNNGFVYFGNLYAGCEGDCSLYRDTHVYTDKYQNAPNVIAELKKDPDYAYFIKQPEELSLNGLDAVEYSGHGELCPSKYVIIIGKKFNYVFEGSCNVGTFKDLEQAAKTVKFIN